MGDAGVDERGEFVFGLKFSVKDVVCNVLHLEYFQWNTFLEENFLLKTEILSLIILIAAFQQEKHFLEHVLAQLEQLFKVVVIFIVLILVRAIWPRFQNLRFVLG